MINPEEAEVVKRIYREYLEGKSYYEIGRGLTADGIKTAAGSEHWLASTLRKILRNEKYIGDALLQKTVTTDFLTKKRVENKGIAPQYYVEDSHQAIIPRELFMMVQEEMVRRACLETGTGKKRVYSGKYALSSIVYCDHCGDIYQRTHWTVHGAKKIVWRCISRLHKKNAGFSCPARTVTEEELQEAVVKVVAEVFADRETYLPQLRENIRKVLGDDNSGRVKELDEKITALEKEIVKRTKARQNCDDLGREIIGLREEQYQLQLQDAQKEGVKRRMEELEEFLKGCDGQVLEYDDALVRKLVERVTVRDDGFVVGFKSGLEVEV